ncbi:FHA domain-containing protein [Microbacterium sp. NPDC087665]|uniref:FHA domain-containing protein n=1 Tax=Microbacterium sp. NPDC087665 TaxID=3364194 RepID=UPI0038246D40
MSSAVESPRAASAGSFAIDVLAALLVALIAALLAPNTAVVLAPAGAVFAIMGLLLWRGILGGGVGHTILRLRSVDRLTGLPSFRVLQTVTVRRGGDGDPFSLRAPPGVFATPLPEPPQRGGEAPHLRLLIDDGTSHLVQRSAIIGRNPVPADPTVTLIAIPDLTRTISRTHLQVDITTDGLVITDLGSSGGTLLDSSDEFLPRHVAIPIPWGTTLVLGTRRVVFEQRRRSGDAA